MMHYFALPRRWLRAILITIVTLFFVLNLGLSSTIAQSPNQAPVVLDGQPLFKISGFGEFSAQERADLINLQLREALQTTEPVDVRLETRNGSPTIRLNDRYLLTITEQDIPPNSTAKDQAQRWVQYLQAALQQAQAERSFAYLRQMGVIAIGLIIVAAILHKILGWLEHRYSTLLIQRLTSDESDATNLQTRKLLQFLSQVVLTIARSILWITTILYIANLFPFTRRWSYQITSILLASFTSSILTLGNQSYTAIDLLILAAMLIGWAILAGMITNLFRTRVLSFAGISRGAQEMVVILSRYALIAIGSLVVLQVWGLNLSSLAIVASALGLGIGLGLQNIAKNFSSGLVLVFERPIQVGDFVEVGDLKGTVERIGGRSTEIRTLDQVSIIVPNSRFLETEVINWSHRNPVSRLHVPVGVAYEADPNAVRVALTEAAESHPDVLKTPPPHVLFTGFGESSLDFELLVWTTEPSKQFLLKSDLLFRVYEILKDRKIEIPFPQRDLHLRSGSLSLSPQVESALMQISEHNNCGRESMSQFKSPVEG